MAAKPHSPRRPWAVRLLWNDLKRSWFMHVTLPRMANPIVYRPSQAANQSALTIATLKNREPFDLTNRIMTHEELREIDAKYGRPHTLPFPTSS